ncbi:MAG: radical SAM protein [Desulfamplus sp.]|nr:radical SAM protein [Desulfamplus sp.]
MAVNVGQFSSSKILKHLDRVNEWMRGDNPPPITVEIDMTNVCNHACPECVAGFVRTFDKSFLSSRLAERIIKELAEFGIRGLIFTGGGEPLCHKNTIDMVSLAQSLGLDVGFITNGQLLNDDINRVLLEKCVWIRVSLDAATPETFSKVHGVPLESFVKVLDNIRRLAQMKQQLKSNTTVGVGFLTDHDTVEEMEPAAALCRDLQVDYLQYRPMQIHKKEKIEYRLTDVTDRIKRCFCYGSTTYNILYSKHKYDMMKEKNYGRYYNKCYGQQFATVITATGKMYICCHLRGYDKYEIGDLSQQSFQEIWNSIQRREVFQNVDFEDCIPLCRDNTFNQILWDIKSPVNHVNFL